MPKTAILVLTPVNKAVAVPALSGTWNSMTTLFSDKVYIFIGCRDISKGQPQAFHFFEKLTYRQAQKLAVILENNVVQNLNFEKKWFYKKLVS